MAGAMCRSGLTLLMVVLGLCTMPGAACGDAVTTLTLINADTNSPVPGFDPFTNGSALDFTSLPTRNLNVRANTSPSTVGSVRFDLDGTPGYRTENTAPYALAGDNSGDYNPWTPSLGSHTLTATPFSGPNASGTAGTPLTVSFTVTESSLFADNALYLYGSVPPGTSGNQLLLTDTGPLGFSEFAEVLQQAGFACRQAQDTTVTLDTPTLSKYSLVILSSNNRRFTASEQSAVVDFVEKGGGVMVFSDGSFGFEQGRASDNDILQHFGMLMHHDNSAGVYTISSYSQQHFITNGVTLKGDGVSMVRVTGAPAVLLAGCQGGNCVLHSGDGSIQSSDAVLAVAESGLGRVAATFDRDTFLNPPGTATDIDEAGNRQYALNVLRWLARHETVAGAAGTVSGELKKWHRVTVTFDGPPRNESGGLNPFTDYRLNVTFSKGTKTVTVPGYFAADGNAGETGSVSGSKWRVHFVPDEVGVWNYAASFRFGENIAVSTDPAAGAPVSFDGASGSFTVVDSDKTGRDHRGKGLLKYVGGHYLQFAGSGECFVKGGADSPENLLGYGEFDGTYDTDGSFIHTYSPHVGDWRTGDPTWRNGKGKGIVGALNYLSGKGMNSVYFLTYNLDGGDGRDTWPWAGPTLRNRFDCSKLDQWETVFSHMDRVGLMLHVVTQETENDQGLDGGALGDTRKLYYRELVARFGHHLALVWNLGEENSNTDAERKAFASYIRAQDPYDHPIVVHTYPGQQDAIYTPLLGFSSLEGPSLQVGDVSGVHAETLKWRSQSSASGRKWFVSLDEIGPASTGVVPDANDYTHDSVRKQALWGNLMAGGAGCEWYFGYDYAHHDLVCEDWRSRDNMWNLTRYAVEFFRYYLPFAEMGPNDGLTSASTDYCLAKPGEVYAVYLPSGGTTNLSLSNSKVYNVRWYNPRAGGGLQNGTVTQLTGPGLVSIGYPPSSTTSDWVALVKAAPVTTASAAAARQLPDGTHVSVSVPMVVSLVPMTENGFFYAQMEDGSSGIRVETWMPLPTVGSRVMITGKLSTNSSGERVIKDVVFTAVGTGSVALRGLNNRALGSAENLDGLLVKTWGKVTHVGPVSECFLVNDGSEVVAADGLIGVKIVKCGAVPVVGQYWSVVGVVTSEMTPEGRHRVLRGREGMFDGDNLLYVQ